jgi:hypothetical protein
MLARRTQRLIRHSRKTYSPQPFPILPLIRFQAFNQDIDLEFSREPDAYGACAETECALQARLRLNRMDIGPLAFSYRSAPAKPLFHAKQHMRFYL